MSPANPARILIVDDERHNRELLAIMLKPEGFVILAASNGTTALALAREQPPDLILLDVMMPGLDGYEVLAELRGTPATKHVPVIMVTAMDDHRKRVLGPSRDAAFLAKPIARAELRALVRDLLQLPP